jgi:heat shock protein HtpX
MYKQISENRWKTSALFVGFFVFIIGLAWVIGYVYQIDWLLPVAAVISIIQALVSYYSGDKIALAVSRAQPVTKAQLPALYRLVENLAITAGVPMPALYFIDDTAINAFATGRDPQHASIAVTRGALEKLENEELEGVLAHELSHVANYDIRVSTIVVVLVGVIALMSDLFTRSLWFGGGRRSRDNEGGSGQLQGILMIVAIVLAVLAPLIATLIQLAVSRKREYLADASGALLTRYPEGLARALEKIGADHEPLEVANKATAHLYFANPLKDYAGKVNELFSTHPPIADRVRRLREMA